MTLRALVVVLVSILIASAVITLSGCAGDAEVRPEPTSSAAHQSSEPTIRAVMVPTLATRPGTLLAQRKGDLAATLLRVPCQVTVVERRETRKATGLGSSLAGRQRYLVTTRERAEFDPDFFTFRIALTDAGGDPIQLPAMVGVEYRINGIPVDAKRTWGPCHLDEEIAPGASAFVRFDLPRVGDLREGDEVLVALRGLDVGNGEKADFVWNLVIAAERTVELKNSTASEWR